VSEGLPTSGSHEVTVRDAGVTGEAIDLLGFETLDDEDDG
jgi:hypothetical protein